jgi:hypothetical protein
VQEVNWRTAAHAQEVYASKKLDPAELNRPANWKWWTPLTDAMVEAGDDTWVSSAAEATRGRRLDD